MHRSIGRSLVTILLFGQLAVAVSSCQTLQSVFGIKDSGTSEYSQASYWQKLTAELDQAAASGLDMNKELAAKAPQLVAMVREDVKHAALFDFWGTSINFDEGAKAGIVRPEIVAAIGQVAAHPMAGRNVHAGLMHTYGYLLSNLVTPYGFKRERWTTPTIDDGFGWHRGSVSPAPEHGTLLINLTAMMGAIAYRGESDMLRELTAATAGASPDVRNLDVATLSVRRLVETVNLSAVSGSKSRTVELRTDVVRLPKVAATSANKSAVSGAQQASTLTHLLIYSIRDSAVRGSRLITAFPMTEGAADGVFKAEDLGGDKLIKTRYNAFVAGLTGKDYKGLRALQAAAKSKI
ncbi:MAG: hypothetical protein NTY08_10870 [Proteobacteria bacterium]|nr:hypothetical protein [Pseudomonadota bacterium]